MIDEIREFSEMFFNKIGVEIDSFDVILEQEDIYFIKIETPDSGILIWNHWSTFESIQWLLRNIFSNKYDRKIRLHLEINDYIHNKDAKLFAFIDKKISFAKEVNRNIKLPVLNWYERKKVHSYVSDLNDTDIKTESRWEWKDRRMFIILVNKVENNYKKPEKKWSGLEIDIDWDDI